MIGTDKRLDPLVDELLPPARPAWRRSKRGNWIRLPARGVCVTVFERWDGWAYCVTDKEGPRFSNRAWASDDEAIKVANSEIERMRKG
jgi:hypothetical protein